MTNSKIKFSDKDSQNTSNNTVIGQEDVIPNSILFNKIASSAQKTMHCPLSERDAPVLDYKNVELLQKFVSERGRILPSRLTGICRKKQRELNECVKKARILALLPFASSQ